jgi:TolB protein
VAPAAVAAFASLLVISACSGDPTSLPFGSIQVSVTTTGTNLDPDGYSAFLNGAGAQAIGVEGSITFSSLAAGDYEVSIGGLAANCSVADNPRTVAVAVDQTTQAAFEVVCAGQLGSLVVNANTSGVDPDPDGYTALVDGGNGRAVANNGSTTFANVTPGDRQVSLEGLAANCSVDGANPRTVTIEPNDIAVTTFNINCVAIISDLEVVTLTTGQNLDPNGYTFTVDGLNPTPIGVNDSVTVGAAAGNRSVQLGSIENNCTVANTNPRPVNVPASGSARVEFVVSCTSNTGSLVVTTTTSGVDLDPNGYTATTETGIFQPIGINATVAVNNVPSGARTVELTGLVSNCTVQGQNPRTVTVPISGAVQTDFAIVCSPVTGTIEVTTNTTGADLDPNGYTIRTDAGAVPDQAIGINATVDVSGVVWGDRTVELLNVDSNCTVAGQNPRTVSVPQQGTVTTTFDVTCTPLTGDLMVTASTTGSNLDANGYMVSVDGGAAQALPTNGSFTFTDLDVGQRQVLLTDIAANCSVTGSNPATVTVPGGDTGTHTFDVTCTSLEGSVEVTAATTGSSPDPDGYTVTVEGETPVAIGVNETKTVSTVAAGSRTVTLSGVAPNCTVGGSNPRSVTVPGGGTVSTTFNVSCALTLDDQIVFDTNRDGNFEIYVMTPSGTGVQRLTNNAARDAEPNVSPDGAKIAFVSDRDGNNEIYVMNVDGSGQTRLTTNGASDREPAWSPDGTQIVFRSDRDGNNEIYKMNADGSDQTRLTNHAASDALPDWHGTKIVFNSARDGDTDVWVMNDDGTGVVQLTNNADSDFAASWSPDGTKIAFTSEQDGDGEIYVMNANGSGQTNLTDNTADDLAPQWSPDGSQIAFASNRDGNNEVYVMDADGTDETNVTNNAANDFEVSWSP